MKLPVVVVNFKLYEQGTGDEAIKLAKICERVAEESGQTVAICVNPIDLREVVDAVNIPVFVQHMDPVSYGSHTGKILPELVKDAGAYGTVINHPEYRLEDKVLEETVRLCREHELFSLVCVDENESIERIRDWGADLIAVEPSELIGGGVSVAKAEPEIVEKAFHEIGDGKFIIGAGIQDSEDVKIALALGANGVFVATHVVKEEDPYTALMDLVSGLK